MFMLLVIVHKQCLQHQFLVLIHVQVYFSEYWNYSTRINIHLITNGIPPTLHSFLIQILKLNCDISAISSIINYQSFNTMHVWNILATSEDNIVPCGCALHTCCIPLCFLFSQIKYDIAILFIVIFIITYH